MQSDILNTMPELPEVETIRIGLTKLIVGKQIKIVEYNWPKGFPNSDNDVSEFLIKASIIDVRRRAKVLIIELSSGYSLVIHLKMTGQLVFIANQDTPITTAKDAKIRWGAGHPNDSLIGSLPDKSTRVVFKFSDGSNLYFNDQRKFGWVRLIPTIEVPNIDFMKKFGPEPLESSFTLKIFTSQIMRRKNSFIKAVLLDQTVIAGIGNIYADESLWAAMIHPLTRVADISEAKVEALYKEIINVLSMSIKKGGSTDRNYVNAEGKKGSYIEFAKVFRRENQPCYRCGTTIKKIRVAGRGTHICLKCQKHP